MSPRMSARSRRRRRKRFDLQDNTGTWVPFGNVDTPQPTNFTPPTGPRISVRDPPYSAKCDGVTQTTARRSALRSPPTPSIFVPTNGCAAAYLINTTVNVGPLQSVVGQTYGPATPVAGSIKTTANVDTFATSGGQASLQNLSINHSGLTGAAVRNAVGTTLSLTYSNIVGSNAASTDDLIYTAGSSTRIDHNFIMNNRAVTAYAINWDKIAANPVNIEGYVAFNQIQGTGAGMWVHTSDNPNRPEGVHLLGNSFLNGGATQLYVNQVLSIDLLGNTFDLGSGHERRVRSHVSNGIDTVAIGLNWFADENGAGPQGECIEFVNTTGGGTPGTAGVSIVGAKFHFCKDGVYGASSLTGATITGNNFQAISNYGLNMVSARRIMAVANIMENMTGGNCMYLADSVVGGPFIVEDNILAGCASGTAGIVYAINSAAKFTVLNNAGVTNLALQSTYTDSSGTTRATPPTLRRAAAAPSPPARTA